MRLVVGLVLALGSAGCFAASYIGQHRAIAGLDALELRHPVRGALRLVRNRGWLVAYASSWVGWGIYIAALSLAPLSLVQAVSAGGIGILAFAASRGGVATTANERVGALLATAGLVLVLVTAHAVTRATPPSTARVAVLVALALGLAATLVVLVPRHLRGTAIGAASGLCYGAGDVATKAAVLGRVVFVPVFLACAALGFVTLQLSYQRASLLGSAGLSALLTNALPIGAGAALFGEVPLRGASVVVRSIGFGAVVIGATVLAARRDPAATT